MRKYFILFISIFLLSTTKTLGKDTTYRIKIHFLYGSRPMKEYKRTERKWFGGKLGGHIGIEVDSGRILNFLPAGAVSLYPNSEEPNSNFVLLNEVRFYSILGGHIDSMKRMTIEIPINKKQKLLLDKISTKYQKNSPYDYAFFGMRCGSSTYDILSKIGVLKKKFTQKQTARRIFYPRRLRKKLVKLAVANKWQISYVDGTKRRKWERGRNNSK